MEVNIRTTTKIEELIEIRDLLNDLIEGVEKREGVSGVKE